MNATTSTLTDSAFGAALRRAALGLLVLLPWMLLLARAGAEISVAAIDLFFLAHAARTRDWQWLRAPFMRAGLLAWLWLLLIVSPFALAPEISVLQALLWGRYLLLVAAIRYWLVVDARACRWVAYSLVPLLFFCAVDTLWQYHTGLSLTQHHVTEAGRLTGPFKTPKIGIFMAKLMLVAMAVLCAAQLKARRGGYVLALVMLAAFAAILLTGERTAAMMLILGFALIGAVVYIRVAKARRRVALLAVVALGMVCYLLATQYWVQETLGRAQSHISHFWESPYGKVFTAAMQVGREHWLTGTGVQGFRRVISERFNDPVGREALGENYLHAHNPYLEWFAEAGLVGLLLFTTLVVILAREGWQRLREGQGRQLVGAAVFMAVWLINFFPFMAVQSYFSNWAGILVWYTVGVAYASINQRVWHDV